MALSCNLRLDVSMAMSGSADHSDQNGPCDGMAVGYQHCHMWQPGLPASSRPLVVTGVKDINTDYSSRRALGSSLGPNITMAPGGNSSSPHLPLQICLCPQDMKHSPFLCLSFPTLHHIYAQYNGAYPFSRAMVSPTHLPCRLTAELTSSSRVFWSFGALHVPDSLIYMQIK